MKISSEKYLSIEDVADFLKVDYQLVYRLVREGRLPAIRVGRVYRVSPAELERFIERSSTTGPSGAQRFVCGGCGTGYGSARSLTEKCAECGAPICFDCAARTGRTHCREHESGEGKADQ